MKSRIGILIRSLNNGGAERAACNLSRDLEREGYDVFLIVLDAGIVTYKFSGQLIDLKAKIRRTAIGKIFEFFKRLRTIRAIKKKYSIDACISYMPDANLYNVLSKYREKTIVSIRNTMSFQIKTRFRRKIISWCGAKSDCTVALSEGVMRDLVENFAYPKEKIVVIYNSCDSEWLEDVNESILEVIDSFDFSKPVIVTTGRLHPQKGQWHLIKAMKKVTETIPDCQLVIFGQGPLKDDLERLCLDLGISNNVHFMGYVRGYHAFMRKCSLFVLPSVYEGLGNVLLEAMAVGMPIISTDCKYGPRELLDPDKQDPCRSWPDYGQYGVLVPPFHSTEMTVEACDEEECMADAIVKMLTDQEMLKDYGTKALIRSLDFRPEKISSRWKSIIEGATYVD